MATFIENNFQLRTCFKYKEKNDGICVCNRDLNCHKDSSNIYEEWSYGNNTILSSCNTFGSIRFPELTLIDHNPKFIRFDCVENIENTCEALCNLLFECDKWNLPIPKLIISINGSLEKLKFHSIQHKLNLKQGLINVMKHDQTLVISSGFNIGIHKLVSETIYEFRLQEEIQDKVSLIGINTWGSIANNQKLTFPENNNSQPCSNRQFQYKCPLENEKGKSSLDGLYDAFLFCDDGTEKQYDKEVEFRLKFENYLKNKTDGFLVEVLFEGGKMSVKHVHAVLNDKIPIVIVKGSGGFADLIASILELPKQKCKEKISSIVNENEQLFDKMKVDIQENINILYEIHTNFRKQIVIYDLMDNTMKLDKKILEAMIFGAATSLEKTLKLCIRFKCPKIANRAVFSNSKYQIIDKKLIENMFSSCLKDNKPEFIELFIENNFDVERYINDKILRELYEISFDSNQCQCAEMLSDLSNSTKTTNVMSKSKCEKEPDILFTIGVIIQKLSGNVIRNLYEKCKNPSMNNKDVQSGIQTSLTVDEATDNLEIEDERTLIPLNTRNLFLWAILSGRTEISQVIWKINRGQMGSALIASTILRRMSGLMLIRGDNTFARKLSETSSKFQEFSVLILNEAYKRSKKKTYILITRRLKKLDNSTCLQIATNSDLLEFLNHVACRSYITKVWMGNLSPILPTWKILLTIPFSLFLIKLLIIPTFPQKKISKEKAYKTNSHNMQRIKNTEDSQYTIDTKRVKRKISFLKAMKIFYSATIVKFYIYLFSYFFFLIIFTFLNLVELKPLEKIYSIQDVSAEIYVYAYVVTFVCEEIRQVYDQKITGFLNKAKEYFSGIWNKIDVFIILLFFLSTVLRFLISKENFMLCRCSFSITLSLFIIRTMQFYFINKSIGPKIIMIRDMLRDILFFLSIFIIFLLAYGTLFQSLKFPNSRFDFTLLKDIFYLPYFQTFGELMLEIFEVSGSCNQTECIMKNATVILSFATYLLLTNILLVNLLIAMFGYTFNQIQEDSEKLWSFLRIMLVQEFYEKHILPPPFNIFYCLMRLFKSCCPKKREETFKEKNNLLFQMLSNKEYHEISDFEQFCVDAVMLELCSQINDLQLTKDVKKDADTYDTVDARAPSPIPDTPEFASPFQMKFERRLENIEKYLEAISQNFSGKTENLI